MISATSGANTERQKGAACMPANCSIRSVTGLSALVRLGYSADWSSAAVVAAVSVWPPAKSSLSRKTERSDTEPLPPRGRRGPC
jgi:hypothetical protein